MLHIAVSVILKREYDEDDFRNPSGSMFSANDNGRVCVDYGEIDPRHEKEQNIRALELDLFKSSTSICESRGSMSVQSSNNMAHRGMHTDRRAGAVVAKHRMRDGGISQSCRLESGNGR